MNSNIMSLTFDNNVSLDIDISKYPDSSKLTKDKIIDYQKVKTIALPNIITEIDNSLFNLPAVKWYSSANLEYISFGSNLKTINEEAFGYCANCKIFDFTKCQKVPELKGDYTKTFPGIENEYKIIVPNNLYHDFLANDKWYSYREKIYDSRLKEVFNISYNIADGYISGPNTINRGDHIVVTAVANQGYDLPTNLIGAWTFTNCRATSLINSDKIEIFDATDNIEITGSCIPKIENYYITTTITHGQVSGNTIIPIDGSKDTELTIIPDEGYTYPTTVHKTGQADMMYVQNSGIIYLDSINSDIELTGDCEPINAK